MEDPTVFVGLWEEASSLSLTQFLALRYPPTSHPFPRLLISPTISSHPAVPAFSALYHLESECDQVLSTLENEWNPQALSGKVDEIHRNRAGICLISISFLDIVCWMNSLPRAVVLAYPEMATVSVECFLAFTPTAPTSPIAPTSPTSPTQPTSPTHPTAPSPPQPEWPLGLGPASTKSVLNPANLIVSLTAKPELLSLLEKWTEAANSRLKMIISQEKEAADRGIGLLAEIMKSRSDEIGNKAKESAGRLEASAQILVQAKDDVGSIRAAGTEMWAEEMESTRNNVEEARKRLEAAKEQMREAGQMQQTGSFPVFIVNVEQTGFSMKVIVVNYKKRFFPVTGSAVDERIGLSLELPLEEGLKPGAQVVYFPDLLRTTGLSRIKISFSLHSDSSGVTPLSRTQEVVIKRGSQVETLFDVSQGVNPGPDYTPEDLAEYLWFSRNRILPEGVEVPPEPVNPQHLFLSSYTVSPQYFAQSSYIPGDISMFDPRNTTYFPRQPY